MECCCCLTEIKENGRFINGFSKCPKCNSIFEVSANSDRSLQKTMRHYGVVDPHENVAFAKQTFFVKAIKYMSSRLNYDQRRILDVGCGFGYFVEIAFAKGWEVKGVEVVEEAARVSQRKIGDSNVFQGTLREADYPDKFFDAVTFWDVLFMVDSPHDELKEAFRVLKRGGILGIRVRNVWFQIKAYKFCSALRGALGTFGIKPFSVFHRYCFSALSIRMLLGKAGFTDICIQNSPLTKGDPYGYTKRGKIADIAKVGIYCIARICYLISRGSWIVGPSLLVWARKPQ